jgi:hypothetical protein
MAEQTGAPSVTSLKDSARDRIGIADVESAA